MRLELNALRYLTGDDWRTLTAVELGQKNHELVPAPLIDTIAKLRHGGCHKALRVLLKHKLLHHENVKYDGYRLTTLGYDYLAINTLCKRGVVAAVGRKIGVGKESDVYEVVDADGSTMVLKLHRLGRTSFRDVKTKRDYLRKGNHYSWLYLSRLAAIKEFAFMKALGERGLPVPMAIDQNRHAVLMEKIEGCTLSQVHELDGCPKLYTDMMDLICSIARLGLVHCDLNEFNVMLTPAQSLVLIDFPQMVSTAHLNAEQLFDRDVAGVETFFAKKMRDDPAAMAALPAPPCFQEAATGLNGADAVDRDLRASGFDHGLQGVRSAAGEDDDATSTDESDACAGCSEEAESTDVELSSAAESPRQQDKVAGAGELAGDSACSVGLTPRCDSAGEQDRSPPGNSEQSGEARMAACAPLSEGDSAAHVSGASRNADAGTLNCSQSTEAQARDDGDAVTGVTGARVHSSATCGPAALQALVPTACREPHLSHGGSAHACAECDDCSIPVENAANGSEEGCQGAAGRAAVADELLRGSDGGVEQAVELEGLADPPGVQNAALNAPVQPNHAVARARITQQRSRRAQKQAQHKASRNATKSNKGKKVQSGLWD